MAESTAQNQAPETHEFQTEVQQLLHLMIHSLYSHKEIFLRELISNAADATDKLRFESLTNDALLEDSPETDIRVSFDKDQRTLTVTDCGIGMNRDEVIENIGTIARSGTKQFVEKMSGEDSKDTNLIGQFGVGFYSVFMVADKVTLQTRKAGDPINSGVLWESDGSGKFSISEIDRDIRGTEITLHLREDESEFLEGYRLRHIITTYSDHIPLEIKMPKEAVPGNKDDESDEENKGEEAGEETSTEIEWETVNKGSALWARPKKDISDEDYNHFYQSLSYDSDAPLATLHNRVEGNLEYISLFFIPSRAPFDLWDRERRHGVKLYVRRIFITDDAENLMPAYLRFIKGVVDSADLPLNVSREFLQKNKQLDQIRNASVKKVLAELKKMADKNSDSYAKFWKEFGKVIKEGVIEDHDNLKAISDLLRFTTTKSDGESQTVSLAEYVKRMPLKQKAIYYITGETHRAASASPHLEIFSKNDIEVLVLSDPIDEWLVNHLTEYEEKPLKSVAKGGIDLEDDDEKSDDKDKDSEDKAVAESLISKLKEVLGDNVKDVRISKRLTDSPACLVADEHDMGGNLERILKSMGQDAPTSKPILELNPDHALVSQLNEEHPQLDDWAHVLFDQAALSEGAPLKEPAAYVKRVNRLLGAQP